MKAEITDSESLRIVLSAEELDRSGFTFDSLTERDPKARAFLLALSRAAGLILQFDAALQSLHIEAYPYADGGCLLCVMREETKPSVLTFYADTFDALAALCRELLPYCQNAESAAYRLNTGYALLLTSRTALSVPETVHGSLRYEDVCAQAVFAEYAELLIGEDAVGHLSGFCLTRAAAYGPSNSDPDC